jgi:hypothetical protein
MASKPPQAVVCPKRAGADGHVYVVDRSQRSVRFCCETACKMPYFPTVHLFHTRMQLRVLFFVRPNEPHCWVTFSCHQKAYWLVGTSSARAGHHAVIATHRRRPPYLRVSSPFFLASLVI